MLLVCGFGSIPGLYMILALAPEKCAFNSIPKASLAFLVRPPVRNSSGSFEVRLYFSKIFVILVSVLNLVHKLAKLSASVYLSILTASLHSL